MIKKITVVPFLFLVFAFSSCNFPDRISRPVQEQATIPAEYTASKKQAEAALDEIYPSEKVGIFYVVKSGGGQPQAHYLTLEFTNPDSFPENDSLLLEKLELIKDEVNGSITNIDAYQELEIVFQKKSEENGFEKFRSVKKTLELP